MMVEYAEFACNEIREAHQRYLEACEKLQQEHRTLEQQQQQQQQQALLLQSGSLSNSRSSQETEEEEEEEEVSQPRKRRKLLQAYCIANTVEGVKTHSHVGCTKDAQYSRLEKHNKKRKGGPRNTRKVSSTAFRRILKSCNRCKDKEKREKPCDTCAAKIAACNPWFVCSMILLPAGRDFSGKLIRKRWTKERRGTVSRVRAGKDLAEEHGCLYLVSEKVALIESSLANTEFDTRPKPPPSSS
jgi:hypothetical protein